MVIEHDVPNAATQCTIVCDDTKEADERIRRVLTNDRMMGIFRHTDAGYEVAQQRADVPGSGVKIPITG